MSYDKPRKEHTLLWMNLFDLEQSLLASKKKNLFDHDIVLKTIP